MEMGTPPLRTPLPLARHLNSALDVASPPSEKNMNTKLRPCEFVRVYLELN